MLHVDDVAVRVDEGDVQWAVNVEHVEPGPDIALELEQDGGPGKHVGTQVLETGRPLIGTVGDEYVDVYGHAGVGVHGQGAVLHHRQLGRSVETFAGESHGDGSVDKREGDAAMTPGGRNPDHFNRRMSSAISSANRPTARLMASTMAS